MLKRITKPGVAKIIGEPNSNNGPKLGPAGLGLGGIETIINELENCDSLITPICLQTLYGLFYKPLATQKNSYGIVEYTPQAYLASDLDMFFKNFSSNLVGSRPSLVSIDGGACLFISLRPSNTALSLISRCGAND